MGTATAGLHASPPEIPENAACAQGDRVLVDAHALEPIFSGPLPVLVLTGCWVRVPGRDRSRRRVAPRRRSRPGRFSGWAAQPRENPVEREEDVPHLDGRAEA